MCVCAEIQLVFKATHLNDNIVSNFLRQRLILLSRFSIYRISFGVVGAGCASSIRTIDVNVCDHFYVQLIWNQVISGKYIFSLWLAFNSNRLHVQI